LASANARATPAAWSDVPSQLTHPLIDFFTVAETGVLDVAVLIVPGIVVVPDGVAPELVGVVAVPEVVVPDGVVPESVGIVVVPEVVVPGDVVPGLVVLDLVAPVLAGTAAAALLDVLLDVPHPTIGRTRIDHATNEQRDLFIGFELWQFGLR